jgi:hypothetical protein
MNKRIVFVSTVLLLVSALGLTGCAPRLAWWPAPAVRPWIDLTLERAILAVVHSVEVSDMQIDMGPYQANVDDLLGKPLSFHGLTGSVTLGAPARADFTVLVTGSLHSGSLHVVAHQGNPRW